VAVGATSVLSATDARAFGQRQLSASAVPYAARYDGRRWRSVTAPLLVTGAASVISPHEIWIAGYVSGNQCSPVAVAHWTGRSWHVLTLPRLPVPRGGSYGQPDVLALSPADVWTDLELRNSSRVIGVVLLHYDGTAWARISVTYPSTGLGAMTADGHGGIWITSVISRLPGSAIYDYRGGRWSRQATPAGRGYSPAWTRLARPRARLPPGQAVSRSTPAARISTACSSPIRADAAMQSLAPIMSAGSAGRARVTVVSAAELPSRLQAPRD
jgi:hypothetical protein